MKVSLSPTARKRFGQYFSGAEVGSLLAALALQTGRTPLSVVDPFLGSGDLVRAVHDRAPRIRAAGVELDPLAAELAGERAPWAEVVCSNAFSPDPFRQLGWSWDLVVSNPPYVRLEGRAPLDDELGLPTADAVREGLRQFLATHPELSDPARTLLLSAMKYSGRADLALPGFLLCCALVAPGGTLALVVPSVWRTRQYAEIVREILKALFDVRVVVDDESGRWFDADVRTSLIVATRTTEGSKASGHRILIDARARDTSSLVGGAFSGEREPETLFAEWAVGERPSTFPGIRRGANTGELGGEQAGPVLDGSVPLSTVGWSVGQGLRTGANDFFYLERDGHSVRSQITGEVFVPPPGVVLSAVRKQVDLPRGFVANTNADPEWMVLAAPDPVELARGGAWQPIARHIEAARTTLGGKPGRRMPIPELSAVRTNVTRAGDRDWFQLPPMRPRHRPVIFAPRLSHDHPRFLFNAGEWIVDANFVTLTRTTDAIEVAPMLAVLNSTLIAARLEELGTVLGGGGIKVEAVDVAAIGVPDSSDDVWTELKTIGTRMIDGTIDPHEARVFATDAMVGRSQSAEVSDYLRAALRSRRARAHRAEAT